MVAARALFLFVVMAVTGCKREAASQELQGTAPVQAPRRIELKVTDDGFQPGNVTVKKAVPLVLAVTRTTDATCATELLIEGTDINTPLPLNKQVEIAWTPTTAGSVKFGCAMDKMIGGVLLVE
jgi:plastocyanin domain-containing protein